MKKGLSFLLLLLVILQLSFISSATSTCELSVELVNQNPYPAISGEYVEVVFQISGVESAACKGARFEFIPSYPFSLDEGEISLKTISGNTWLNGYENDWMVGYSVLIDKNALNEKYNLKIEYAPGDWPQDSNFEKTFEISVEDLEVDFEIYVNDYDSTSKELTFEILNIGKTDVEALTIEIPKQESIGIKGANRKVIGDLDSNEYTTASFEANIEGQKEIDLTIFYTDSINERRSIDKIVHFDADYFKDLTRDQKSKPVFLYIVIIAFIAWIVWVRVKKHKKNKHKK